MKTDPLPALCIGMTDLFDSTDHADHIEARKLCRDCPIIATCRTLLTDTQRDFPGGPRGTWAGQLLGGERNDRRGECPTCGAIEGRVCKTPNGKSLGQPHSARINGLPKCEICRGEFAYGSGRFRYCSEPCSTEARRRTKSRWHARRPSRAGERTGAA